MEDPAECLDGIRIGALALGHLIEQIPVPGTIAAKREGWLFNQQSLPHHLSAQQGEKPQDQIELLGRQQDVIGIPIVNRNLCQF